MAGHTNNIFGIRINTVMSNGSVNFGNSLHTRNQSNLKISAGYYHSGDANNSPLQFNNANNFNDQDVNDQTQQQL